MTDKPAWHITAEDGMIWGRYGKNFAFNEALQKPQVPRPAEILEKQESIFNRLADSTKKLGSPGMEKSNELETLLSRNFNESFQDYLESIKF